MSGTARPWDLPDESTHCLCDALRAAARAVSTAYDEALRPAGLRVTQFTLLARASRMGPTESQRFAAALGLDKTTLPRNLRPLERRGLIAVEAGRDRRTRLIRITPAGERLLRRAAKRWRSVQSSFEERLTGKGFDQTLQQLLKVRDIARRRGLKDQSNGGEIAEEGS